jgi:hypothetical protein
MAAVGFSYFSENSLFFTNPPLFFGGGFQNLSSRTLQFRQALGSAACKNLRFLTGSQGWCFSTSLPLTVLSL